MRVGLFVLFCIAWNLSVAQNEVLLKIPEVGKQYSQFVPNGYVVLEDIAKGDLNGDGKEDVVLPMGNEKLEHSDTDSNRILVVLLKTNDGYQLAGKSDRVLLCKVCGGIFGDPFAGIEIKKGVLIVNHYGGSAWRWSNVKKFRFQNGGMYLIGMTTDWFWINGDCDENGIGNAGRKYRDENFITGDLEVIERDEDCKLIIHKKTKVKRKPLIKLEDYQDLEK